MWLAFRIPYNLTRILWRELWRFIWYPLLIVRRNIFWIGLAGLGIYVYMTLFYSPPEPGYRDQLAAPADTPAPAGTQLAQPVVKTEDGNSAFSSDLLRKMRKDELAYYSQVFYSTMNTAENGAAHQWSWQNIHGTLTPTDRFTNKRGETCRRFNEVLKVHETQQNLSGIACEKQGGGWCKLRPSSTPACDLGRKPGFGAWWSDLMRDTNSLFR